MLKAGIVDPTKIARTALQNAASVAATLLTTESVIAEIETKDTTKQQPTPSEPGKMGMY